MRTMLLTIILCGMAYGFPASWVTQTPVQSTGMPPIRIAGSNLTTSCYQYWNWQNGSLLYTNLVAWYDMYTNSGTGYNAGTNEVDFSVSNSPATVFVGTSSGATWYASSGVTSAYYNFIGSSYLKLPNFNRTVSSPFSISCWLCVTNLTPISYEGLWVIMVNNIGFQCFISCDANYGTYSFGSSDASLCKFKTVELKYPTNQWQHLVLTYNGFSATQQTNYTVFVNGGVRTISTTSGYSAQPNENVIGIFNVSRWGFTGNIDDWRLYNIALSAQQVTNIFEATKALHPNNWP